MKGKKTDHLLQKPWCLILNNGKHSFHWENEQNRAVYIVFRNCIAGDQIEWAHILFPTDCDHRKTTFSRNKLWFTVVRFIEMAQDAIEIWLRKKGLFVFHLRRFLRTQIYVRTLRIYSVVSLLKCHFIDVFT